MKNHKYKNVDFTTTTTYAELQLLYASSRITLTEFAENVVFFWQKMNYSYDDLCEDYENFKYCFNIFMEKAEPLIKNMCPEFIHYYNIVKICND